MNGSTDALIERSDRSEESKEGSEMSRAHRDGFGTALGPYTGADLAEWHMQALTGEAERARLAHAAAKPIAASDARARKRHLRRHHRVSHAH